MHAPSSAGIAAASFHCRLFLALRSRTGGGCGGRRLLRGCAFCGAGNSRRIITSRLSTGCHIHFVEGACSTENGIIVTGGSRRSRKPAGRSPLPPHPRCRRLVPTTRPPCSNRQLSSANPDAAAAARCVTMLSPPPPSNEGKKAPPPETPSLVKTRGDQDALAVVTPRRTGGWEREDQKFDRSCGRDARLRRGTRSASAADPACLPACLPACPPACRLSHTKPPRRRRERGKGFGRAAPCAAGPRRAISRATRGVRRGARTCPPRAHNARPAAGRAVK
jgi:hypothetical protein